MVEVDIRVDRTKALVLGHVREMLATSGPDFVTYSTVAKSAGTTRQTLYRHWPTISALLTEALLAGPTVSYPTSAGLLRDDLVAFLRSLRNGMRESATASGLLALMSSAEHDDRSTAALRSITHDRRKELNALIGRPGAVDTEGFARLAGPVLFRRFVQRQSVTNAFIDHVVDAFLAAT